MTEYKKEQSYAQIKKFVESIKNQPNFSSMPNDFVRMYNDVCKSLHSQSSPIDKKMPICLITSIRYFDAAKTFKNGEQPYRLAKKRGAIGADEHPQFIQKLISVGNSSAAVDLLGILVDSVEKNNVELYKQLRTFMYQITDNTNQSKISMANIYNSLIHFYTQNESNFSKKFHDKIRQSIYNIQTQQRELSTEDRYNTIKNIYEIGHRLQDKLQQMMQIKLTISNDSILKNQEYLQRYLTQLKAKKRVDTNILTIIDKIDGTEEDYVVTETFRKSNAVLYNPVYKVRLLEYTIKGGMKMLKMLQSDNKYAVEQLCSTIMRKHKGVQANMKKVAPRQAFSSINIIFFIINCIGKMFGLSCNWN
jgi:hypothetical protein